VSAEFLLHLLVEANPQRVRILEQVIDVERVLFEGDVDSGLENRNGELLLVVVARPDIEREVVRRESPRSRPDRELCLQLIKVEFVVLKGTDGGLLGVLVEVDNRKVVLREERIDGEIGE
jgi:hypothetical protein